MDDIKIGDFVKGSYKCGCICGVVVDVKKSIVIIKKCNQHYNEYTLTEKLVNVTKSRIREVGLNENETLKLS